MSSPSRPWGKAAPLSCANYSAVELSAEGSRVFMLEQRDLPSDERYVTLTTVAEVARAITDMVVRGAPAIGISAAYGMVLAMREMHRGGATLEEAARVLANTRPTAVNLQWALSKMVAAASTLNTTTNSARELEFAEVARRIHRDDVESCRAMGRFGADTLAKADAVLTHCNAGALATGGVGTALGVIREMHARKTIRAYATETRPYLQGARLTAWELRRDGIDVTLIGDSMVGALMASGQLDAVVVGADRIARNGDVANKIGTYMIAALAGIHSVPVIVAAPWSTFDASTATGRDIPIEQRADVELTQLAGRQLAPPGTKVYNPAFDVTPASLVHRIVTETGAFEPSRLAEAAPAGAS